MLWAAGAAAALVVGIGLRLALGPDGAGDRSAGVMAALLIGGAWMAAMLLSTPRAAFLVALAAVALFDLAAISPRSEPVYDAREAFYRTDQVLSARVQVAPGQDQTRPVLTLLVEPIFPASATQPRFGLAGDVGSTPLAWQCTFKRGPQQLALPLPSTVVSGSASVDIRLHLSGAPSRETDYLLAYASARAGGFLVSLVSQAEVAADATTCVLQ